jgi:hypothetical protein
MQINCNTEDHTSRDQITSTFFVRLSVDESMIWEGFLVGSLSDREVIHLRLPQGEDLRPALESWTGLQKLLREYPDFHHSFEPYYGNGLFQNALLTFPSLYEGAASFNARIKSCHDECMKNLTCTIVAVGTNLNDRRLLITTHGLDKDAMALAGYCHRIGSSFPTTLPCQSLRMEFHLIDHARKKTSSIFVHLRSALTKWEILCNAGSIFHWPVPRQLPARSKVLVSDTCMPLSSAINLTPCACSCG